MHTSYDQTESRLLRRFGLLVAATILVASTAYVIWSFHTQEQAAEETALGEARTMEQQMRASWDYISAIQDTVNYDSSGNFEFKGVYCATAAKQMASAFTENSSGYRIRYVRDNPRNIEDVPDPFEASALQAFRDDMQTEYFGIEDQDGIKTFRYVSALSIEQNCLSCHGDPAGSRDPTGSYREGFSVGDLAGASSISIPLKPYQKQAEQRALLTVVFFALLLLTMVFIIQMALRRWVVDPLHASNRRLEEDNASKNDFLTLMSHELRTPLSSIIAFTDIWRNSPERHDEQEEYLVDEIRDNSGVLLGMVNNIIDVAKMESGKYELTLEEVDVLDVIGITRSTIEPIALKKGVHVAFDVAKDIPIITSDWEALRKILTNLIGNAVKFTEPGGTVTTTGWADEKAIMISVGDDGCGIREEDLERIFRRFEQGTGGTTRDARGSGLGLSLSHGLATMLGGSISVTSEPGVGSTFTLTIPLEMDREVEDGGDQDTDSR